MDIRTNDFDAQKGETAAPRWMSSPSRARTISTEPFDYYFLNNSLSARTEFESTVPSFQRNEMGATFGGPIIKDKFFVYGAIDVLRSSTTSAGQYTVETQAFDTYAESQSSQQRRHPSSQDRSAAGLSRPSNILTVSQLRHQTPGYFRAPAGIPADLKRWAPPTSATPFPRTDTSGVFAATTTSAKTTAFT